METIIEAVKAVRRASVKGCRFASLTYRASGTGELARHNLLLGVNYERAYKRDLKVLQSRLSRLPETETLRKTALVELIESLQDSIKNGIGNNELYTQKDTYEPICEGVKIHVGTHELYISGFSQSKVVLEPGVYKTVNSKPLTVAKNIERKSLKTGRIRQFKLNPENLQTVKADGLRIEMVCK